METVTIKIVRSNDSVESEEFTRILARMYLGWADLHGLNHEIISTNPEIGSHEIIIEIDGESVCRKLSSESGIHRLSRISPYDSEKRRHTSFASVQVDGVNNPEQIRNYTLDPYKLVKDLRSGFESDKVDLILDGYIDALLKD